MGIESKNAPPLPAPTESESLTSSSPTELAAEISKPADDEKSSFSLPDDGTPVTIKTRSHHQHNRSQTSLLIEYFEHTKSPESSEQGSSRKRKPSVRVRLTPSKTREKNGHIQITETKSSRKASMGKKSKDEGPLVQSHSRNDLSVVADPEDSRSMNSYASATEESNVSRQPIEVEITPSQITPSYRSSRRDRKVSSPLIPAADSKSSSYVPPDMSDISAIGTDSFLDGSGGTTSSHRRDERSRSPSRPEPLAIGALGAVTAAVAADKMNRKTRSASHDRKIIEMAVEKASRPDKKHRSSSRRSNGNESELDSKISSRRRSKGHKESVVSGADSSVLSSQLSPSHRSYDSHSSSKVSINNPKLLETVEDAIRRLILPELDAIKRERSVRDVRKPKERDSLSSLTSFSREELSATYKRLSNDTTQSTKSRGREARNDLSPHSSVEHISVVDSFNDHDNTPQRGHDHLANAALFGAGAAAGATAAERDRSRDDKRQRRRRRAKTPERGRASEEYRESEHEVVPPMPLSSEINPSEMTRTSIMSANTDRPHSASEEMTPVQEVARGIASMESMHDTPTPTHTPLQQNTLQSLGAQHANVSHGDLKALPRKGPGEYEDQELTESDLSQNYPHDEFEDEYEDGRLGEPGMFNDPAMSGYYQQDVPPPLRYVPYQQERRGLSPIQSVSGYTEGSDLRRDSRATHSELSSPGKSPGSIPSNMRSREFGDEESDLRSSAHYRDTQYTDDSELDRITSGQAVRGVGANPFIVHPGIGAESAVASLVDGSVMEPSVLSAGQEYRDSQISYDDRDQGRASGGSSPAKRSFESRREVFEKRNESPAISKNSRSNHSREFEEYDLDEYGRKVPRQNYRHSPSPSEAAITSAALGMAAAAAKAKNEGNASSTAYTGEGVQRNRSFKERAKDGYRPDGTPRHSVDRLSEEYDRPKMEASGLPDTNNPLPEIGYFMEHQSPSMTQETLDGAQYGKEQHWGGDMTPTQEKTFDYSERAATPKVNSKASGNGLGVMEAAAAAAMAAAAGMAATHSRQPSQEQDDEWQRTSGDRKRDTLVTNPYEGASPIANLPGLDGNILGGSGFDHNGYRGGFNTGSPGLPQGDEGYETAPNETRDMQAIKGKGVEFQDQSGMRGNTDDPFYAPIANHQRHLSGLSQGMGSPFYDSATGTGMDRIESKDVIALMEHLMVRDAQRSARDREMIETVCQVIKEMHTSFRDVKRALADTEDQIINEVKDNTEKTVHRHLGGPRPLPGSGSRSVQGGSLAGTVDDLPAKKRNLFRRALNGLSSKGNNDLGRIEDMLMHLLTEVDVLKQQTGGPANLAAINMNSQSLDHMQQEMQYEQDRGYEPEGNAGTSTASHTSQSGHLSIPQSRGQPGRMGYDRKFSDHRISTVHEGPEDEYDQPQVTAANGYSNDELFMSPAVGPARGGSVPLGTPPQPLAPETHQSLSHENTPTENSKKHRSKGSSSFLPKISRWSETTTSSIGRVFRNSGQSRAKNDQEEFLQHHPSRSGSDLNYEVYEPHDPYGNDKLHTGFSEQNLAGDSGTQARYQLEDPPMPNTYSTPEDPKYKAHRNSVNLQHPQPRPGQTERFRTALESSAINYDTPMSPRSADWAGSATSLNRFPGQQSNRYSDQSAADEYRNTYGTSSPAAQGPPRPPKEPLDTATPPRNQRVNKLQKKQSPSPLPYHSVESGYGTMTGTQHARTESYHSTSPRLENRNLSDSLGAPARRPSGPRAMTPRGGLGQDDGDRRSLKSPLGDSSARDERRRKRDTFGTVTGRDTALSQESETF